MLGLGAPAAPTSAEHQVSQRNTHPGASTALTQPWQVPPDTRHPHWVLGEERGQWQMSPTCHQQPLHITAGYQMHVQGAWVQVRSHHASAALGNVTWLYHQDSLTWGSAGSIFLAKVCPGGPAAGVS